MESGVDFVAVDMHQANPLTIHILATIAENEREAISQLWGRPKPEGPGWEIPTGRIPLRVPGARNPVSHSPALSTIMLVFAKPVAQALIKNLRGLFYCQPSGFLEEK